MMMVIELHVKELKRKELFFLRVISTAKDDDGGAKSAKVTVIALFTRPREGEDQVPNSKRVQEINPSTRITQGSFWRRRGKNSSPRETECCNGFMASSSIDVQGSYPAGHM